MTTRCALYMGALKIFGTPRLRPQLIFPNFWEMLKKSVALPVPEI